MMRGTRVCLFSLCVIVTIMLCLGGMEECSAQEKMEERDLLLSKARSEGTVKVLVTLAVQNLQKLTADSVQFQPPSPEKSLAITSIPADENLTSAISATTSTVFSTIQGTPYSVTHTYKTVPFLALDASEETLLRLESLADVLKIEEDKPVRLIEPEPTSRGAAKGEADSEGLENLSKPLLDDTVSLIGADDAWAAGYSGDGWYVAILDSGIRRTHEFFSGKTIVEACFSARSHCPNGSTSMYGTGAAAHHSSSYQGWDHGTHVAGIATGTRSNGTLYGIARNSNIIAVQVFSKFTAAECEGTACVMSYTSDQIAGLDYIYSLRGSYNIASVNMSLGGGSYSSYCDSESQKPSIDNLKSAGIATVIATGNDGYCGSISSPACISSAIAVGSSTKTDAESSFNNWHDTLQELFAPGSSIYSSTADSTASYESWNGTSMATPHVAGAWAVLKQQTPSASVDQVFEALKSTGISITTGCGTGVSKPRIRVDSALNSLGEKSYLLWTR